MGVELDQRRRVRLRRYRKKKERATHCAYCFYKFESQSEKTIDHKVPRARGGDNRWWNLAVVCYRCNQSKGAMPYEDYKEKVATAILTNVLKGGKK